MVHSLALAHLWFMSQANEILHKAGREWIRQQYFISKYLTNKQASKQAIRSSSSDLIFSYSHMLKILADDTQYGMNGKLILFIFITMIFTVGCLSLFCFQLFIRAQTLSDSGYLFSVINFEEADVKQLQFLHC